MADEWLLCFFKLGIQIIAVGDEEVWALPDCSWPTALRKGEGSYQNVGMVFVGELAKDQPGRMLKAGRLELEC